jgi:hypothetical protein
MAARAPFLRPLTGSAGLWQPAKPSFAALANSALGNAGSSADGTDASILNLMQALSAASPLLDAITRAGTLLQAADIATNAIKLPDLDAAIAAAQAASSGQLAKLGQALGLLATSPSWTAGVGPPPPAPACDVTAIGAPAPAGGSGLGSEELDTAGVTAAAASLVASLHTAAVIGTAVASEALLAITVIGIAVGVALILVHYFGHGCGQPCIDAAKAEQIYEAAVDDIFAVYKLGMITQGQTIGIMTHLFAAGTQHMAGFNTSQANKGAINMQTVISALIAQVPHTAQAKATPLNLNTAHLDYIQGPGWYPDALTAATPLADEYLTAVTTAKGA